MLNNVPRSPLIDYTREEEIQNIADFLASSLVDDARNPSTPLAVEAKIGPCAESAMETFEVEIKESVKAPYSQSRKKKNKKNNADRNEAKLFSSISEKPQECPYTQDLAPIVPKNHSLEDIDAEWQLV